MEKHKKLIKISAQTWNDKFELPEGSYSVSHIHIFKTVLSIFKKKHKEKIINIKINAIKIENRIVFKIKTGYYLELLTPKTMKLLGSTENKITKNNGENVPHHLEITEVVLIHCNIANNDHQQDSRVFYTFVPNKAFGNLLEIAPTNFISLKTFNSEFQTIEVWLTDQNSSSLEIEDRINLTLVVK